MPSRVLPGKERVVPVLSFKFPIVITFSIGTTEKLGNQITEDILNLNKDVSDVCREIIKKDLKLRTKVDEDIYFAEVVKSAKQKIYNDLGINRQKSFSSDYIIIKLQKYIKDKKKELGVE